MSWSILTDVPDNPNVHPVATPYLKLVVILISALACSAIPGECMELFTAATMKANGDA